MKIKTGPNNKPGVELEKVQEMTVRTQNELDVIGAKLDRILQKRNGGIKDPQKVPQEATEQ